MPFLEEGSRTGGGSEARGGPCDNAIVHSSCCVVGLAAEIGVTAVQAFIRLQTLVSKLWATSTLTSRQSLWKRLVLWCRENHLEISPDNATLFVMATGVTNQGKLAYAKGLSGTFLHLGEENRPLKSLAANLRAVGGAIPVRQALPLPRSTVLQYASTLTCPRLKLCVLIAWKTASRWGEVRQLRSTSFLNVTEFEVVVDWFDLPKGRRADPFSPSRFTVIVGAQTAEIARLFHLLHPFSQLCETTTSQLDVLWKETTLMRPFTAHSIKRGAVTLLVQLRSQGYPLDEAMISRVAKYGSQGGFAKSTLRYGADPLDLARTLGTEKITISL